MVFNIVLAILGVLVAFPMKRRVINDEQRVSVNFAFVVPCMITSGEIVPKSGSVAAGTAVP
jgi:hypothetical protein